MDTVTIKSKEPWNLPSISDRLSEKHRLDVESTGDGRVAVHGKRSRLYLYTGGDTASGSKQDLYIDYSDIELVKIVIAAIANDPEMTVDNDCGTSCSGDQFIIAIRSKPGWDWRC